MINNWKFCFGHPPSPIPYHLSVSIKYLTFKENLSELQPCQGNWYLVSRNAGNNVFECSFSKISWGSMPPDPLGSLRFERSKAPCGDKNMSRPVLSRTCPLLYKIGSVLTLAGISKGFPSIVLLVSKRTKAEGSVGVFESWTERPVWSIIFR